MCPAAIQQEIGIHIIGPGYGETIVIELPDGKIGIVDCYAATNERGNLHPIFRFINEKLKNTSVKFLCLTHPHADHCLGITDLAKTLIKKGKLESLLFFDEFDHIGIANYFKVCLEKDIIFDDESVKLLRTGSMAREILNFYFFKEESNLKKIYLTPQRKIKLCDSPEVDLFVLGPLDSIRSKYRQNISSLHGLFRYTNPGKTEFEVSDKWDPKKHNHNYASPIFLIKYGDTRILLTGDAEDESWDEMLNDNVCKPPIKDSLAINLIKISHHGSKNSYIDSLYHNCFCDSKGLAIITGWYNGDKMLPSAEGVDAIPETIEVLTTCRELAKKSSGKNWVVPKPELELEPEISLSPSLIADMDEDIFLGESPKEVEKLQRQNADELSLREDDYRVSFFFDNKGNENKSKRYCGIETGILER